MADINLFTEHFRKLSLTEEDFSEVGANGLNTGLSKVKGYTDNVEVLTSRGWMLFEQVGEILIEEQKLYNDYLNIVTSVRELGGGTQSSGNRFLNPVTGKQSTMIKGSGMGDVVDRIRYSYEPLLVATVTPYVYDSTGDVENGLVDVNGELLNRGRGRPKGTSQADVLQKSGGTGRIVFVQPEGYHKWVYNRDTIRLKMRGVDVRTTLYAEIPVKRKYKEGYHFLRADKIWGNRYPEYYYLVLNKFSRDIGKTFHPAKTIITTDKTRDWWWNLPQTSPYYSYMIGETKPPTQGATQSKAWFLREVEKTYIPKAFIPTNIFVEGRGAELYPNEHAKISNGYEGDTYNLTVPKNKTIIVRRKQPENKTGIESKQTWVGNPIVVGDNSNKHLPSHGGYRKPSESKHW